MEAIEQRLRALCDHPDGVLFSEPSGIHFVTVEKAGDLIRLVLLDQVTLTSTLVQSVLDLRAPFSLTAHSTQALLLGVLLCPNPQRFYVAGFGGGQLPLVLHHYFPQVTVDCTDLDPILRQVAQQFFGVEFDARLHLTIADGRQYLQDLPDQNLHNQQQPLSAEAARSYDVLFIDVALGNGYTPHRLATAEFYELCRDRLQPDGVVVVNFLGSDPVLPAKIKTLQSQFEQVYVCPIATGNRVAIATNGAALDKADFIARAKAFQIQHQLAFSLAERAADLKTGTELLDLIPELDTASILKDDQPPAETLEQLPSFNTLFSTVEGTLPCPCGSGRAFQDCHGQRDAI